MIWYISYIDSYIMSVDGIQYYLCNVMDLVSKRSQFGLYIFLHWFIKYIYVCICIDKYIYIYVYAYIFMYV